MCGPGGLLTDRLQFTALATSLFLFLCSCCGTRIKLIDFNLPNLPALDRVVVIKKIINRHNLKFIFHHTLNHF